jgi:hypothetical protein
MPDHKLDGSANSRGTIKKYLKKGFSSYKSNGKRTVNVTGK